MTRMRVLIGLSAVALLSACAPQAHPAADALASAEASASAAPQPGGSIDVARLDNGRPAFAADYPGASGAASSASTLQSGMRSGMLQFESTDSPQAIVSYYQARTNAAGFAPSVETSGPDGSTLYNATGAGGAQFGVVVSAGSPHKVVVTWVAPA